MSAITHCHSNVSNMNCLVSTNNLLYFLFHIGDGVSTVNIAGISTGSAVVSSAVILFILMTVCACQKKKKRKDHNIGNIYCFC